MMNRSSLSVVFVGLALSSWLFACDEDLVPVVSGSPSPVDAGVTAPDGGAGDDAGGGAPTLTFGASPVTGLPEGVRFAGGVPYGDDAEQALDAFLPAATAPTAAIVYVHGGGFRLGSRKDAYEEGAPEVHRTLEAGVAWIGVDYRLLRPAGVEDEGVIKCLRDSQRALQFVRHHARVFNVDPARVGMHGVSAGAGTGLWLAFHDDMATPASADPVARESTRPAAVSAAYTQGTYDLLRWAPDVFRPAYAYVSNDVLLANADLRTLVVQFYGLDGALAANAAALLEALTTPRMVAYRADVDMIALMSGDDPPAYLFNDQKAVEPLAPDFDLLHHPLHGRALVQRAADAKVSLSADIPAYAISSAGDAGAPADAGATDDAIGFVLAHLEP